MEDHIMRNIVMITWDSVRADHCSCYGYSKNTTPFLNKAAKSGLKFENAIITGPPTPVSMAGIFTSSHINGNIRTERTLAQVLKAAGISTAAFHSNPFASRYYGFNKGFDTFKDYVWRDDKGYRRSSKFSNLRKILSTALSRFKLVDVEKVRFYYNILCVLTKNKYDVGLRFIEFYEDILKWVEKNSKRGYYFLWILMIETHFPYAPSNWNRWRKARSMLVFDRFYRTSGIQHRVELSMSEKNKMLVIDAYDDCIKEADYLTEQLWKDLRDSDPIFIIHADHGEAFGEHGFFGHPREHYDYLIRVPLIIYNADVKGTVKDPVSLVRLAPTVCELAGIENPFKNLSLLKDVKYTPPVVENVVRGSYRITVRDKKWKLIVNPDRENELYNILNDPMEKENLIGSEPDIEKELKKIAENHLKLKREKAIIKRVSRRL